MFHATGGIPWNRMIGEVGTYLYEASGDPEKRNDMRTFRFGFLSSRCKAFSNDRIVDGNKKYGMTNNLGPSHDL